ncbi:MAG: Fe-S-containing hydro-lyase [Phycisphaerae bacterium]|jgi:fumarate hydratase subunit beta
MIKLSTPIDKAALLSLRAGDEVLISGTVYSGRDMAHKRLTETLAAGGELPVELRGELIYFVGPSPAAPGRAIGSAGPTTSSRMDPFSPVLLDYGLAGMIGKGYRGEEVVEAIKRNGAVHFSAIGGAGALLSKAIVEAEIVAYPELGTEAIHRLKVIDFPAIVAYDSLGNCVYER